MTQIADTNTGSGQLDRAAELRNQLVDKVVAERAEYGAMTLSARVQAAVAAVPRHCFIPGVSVEEAYENGSVVTKRDERGAVMSSVSQPAIISMMLDQLDLQPGHKALELGSGGYNAALMQELVGPDGHVTTVDIDPDVTDRARAGLAAAGYSRVDVICADGEFGAPASAPFDRIEVTVETADVLPAWVAQLTEGGRIVAPLCIRGLTRSLALDRKEGYLESVGNEMCGFVPMQGAGALAPRLVALAGEDVGLRIDDDFEVDGELLGAALASARVEVWSQVTVKSREPFDFQGLWLATALPEFCLLTASADAVGRGLVNPTWRLQTPAVVLGDSFAYRTIRPVDGQKGRHELGAYGHGPHGAEAASLLVEQMQVWDEQHRGGSGPVIRIYPADTAEEALPPADRVITRRHTIITISWPGAEPL